MTTASALQPDFVDAHARHWTDGEILFERERWANADHLYGLSAECGLKAIMVSRRWIGVDAHGNPDRPYKIHIDQLWEKFLTLARGRAEARYISLLSSSNPFRNWHIAQRYVQQGSLNSDIARLHRLGANQVCSLVRAARGDGLLA